MKKKVKHRAQCKDFRDTVRALRQRRKGSTYNMPIDPIPRKTKRLDEYASSGENSEHH